MAGLGKTRSGASFGKPKGRGRVKAPEVAGPYRSQSSVPKVRAAATPHEHRRVPTPAPAPKPAANPFAQPSLNHVLKAAAAARATREHADARVKEAEHRALQKLHTTLRAAPVAPLPGQKPPASLKKIDPVAYGKAERAYIDRIAQHEGLKEDPAAEFAIDTAATLGLGTTAKLTGLAGKAGVEALAARLGSTEATVGEKAAETGFKALTKRATSAAEKSVAKKVERVRTAPERAVRSVKEAPRKVREAPGKAKTAASTSAGRRAAGRAAGRSARRHPVRSGYGAAVALPEGVLPGDLTKRARGAISGEARAIVHHPGEYLEGGEKAALGFFTAPVDVAGAALKSATTGSTAPLEATSGALVGGVTQWMSDLFSGNVKRAEKAAIEAGPSVFIPGPAILRRLKGTSIYEDAIRGTLRDTVENRRAVKRAIKIEAEKAAQKHGEPAPKSKVKQSVEVTDHEGNPTGEHYVSRRAGAKIESQKARHDVSRIVSRNQHFGEQWGLREAAPIVKAIRKSKLVSRSTRDVQNAGDAVALFAKNGLPANEAVGRPFVETMLKNYPEVKHGDLPSGVFVDRHAAKWILDHPEIWTDKGFHEAVKAFKAQSERIGFSDRHRFLSSLHNQVNPRRAAEGLHRKLAPEEMVTPKLVELLPKREKPWDRVETLDYIKELRQIKGVDRAKAREQAAALTDAFEHAGPKGEGLMKPESHGGPEKGIATTRSLSYTPQMQEAFTRGMLAEHKRLGLTVPAAHVADVLPSPPEGISTAPDYASGLPSRSVKRSRGEAAKSGNAESGFEATLAHSVYGPRMMRAMNRAVSQVIAKGTRQIGGKRLFTRPQMIRAINRHEAPEDTVWLRPQFIKGALSGPHPIDPLEAEAVLKGEIAQGRKLANSVGSDLRKEVEAAEGTKGEKFAPVSGAYVRELVGQMEQLPKISRGLAKFSNASSRTILNSPAFLAVQIPQEGIPLLATMGRNIRYLPSAIKTVIDAHKNLDPEQIAEIKAVVGSSAGVQASPTMQQLSRMGVMDPIRAAAPKAVWRHVWEAVSGTKVGRADMARSGLFREVATAVKVEGDFRRLGKGMKNIYRDIEGANKAMKGMSAEQRLAWSSAHPVIGDRIMRGMNEAIGNWNSATAFEKQFAPALIFYRFQRFSVLWTLYHFPLNHPVAATALAWLAQSNAKMLEEVAASEGKKITNPLQYTYPVIVNKKGPVTKRNTTVLSPLGTRVSPALSSAAQALVEGKPAELSSALPPWLGVAVSAAYGKNPYTGQPLGENGFEWAARQIIAQSPAARALNLQNVGKPTGQSTLGTAFEKLGTEKGVGKFFNPFGGQSGAKFAMQVRLEAALKSASENSKGTREDLARQATREGKKLPAGTIAKMEARSEKTQGEIEKILRSLGLSKQDAKEYQLFKENLYEDGGSSGGYGSSFEGSSGASSSYGSKFKSPSSSGGSYGSSFEGGG